MTKLITKVHYDGTAGRAPSDSVKSSTIMRIFWNRSSGSKLLVHGLSRNGNHQTGYRGPLTHSSYWTEPSCAASQWTEWSLLDFLSCPHSKDWGWRHSHLSNPSNQGRHDQMVQVLLEGVKGGWGGKMPTDLNQINQMPGDGDITVSLPHCRVSQKYSSERALTGHS